MATFTSKAAGNWSASGTTTWTQSGVPTSGDIVTISHAVTVDVDTSIGLSRTTSPYAKPTVSATGGGSTGGALPAGASYTLSFAYVDGSGNETSESPSTTSTNVAAGNIPRVTFPALPAGVTSISLYASAGTGGTRRRYRTGITTTTYDMVDDQWENDTVAQGSAAAVSVSEAVTVSAGSLTIASGVTFTVKGDIKIANVVFTLNAGAILEFNSASSDSSAAVYDFRMGTAATQTTTKLLAQGTSGSHCAIRSNASGGVCRIEPTSLTSSTCLSLIDCTYTDFTRVGSATQDGVSIQNSTANISICTLANCVFDTCGWLTVGNITNPVATSGWSVTNCTWRNSPYRNSLIGNSKPADCIFTCTTTSTNIARTFDHNVLYWQLNYTGGGATWTNNYLDSGAVGTGASSFTTTCTFSNNFYRFITNATISNTDTQIRGDIVGNYAYFDSVTSTAIVNPHGWRTGPISGAQLFNQNIFETNGSDGAGDAIKDFVTVGAVITITYNLFIPNGAKDLGGADWGAIGTITVFSTGVGTVVFQHNTYFAGSYDVSINEGGSTAAVVLTDFRSNLAWSENGTITGSQAGPYLMSSTSFPVSANTLNGAITPANTDYNFLFNAKDAGYARTTYGANAGYGYNIRQDASTPWGLNDIPHGTGNPTTIFSDPTLNLKKWGTTLGYSGTNTQVIQAVLDAFRAFNEPANANYNAAVTVAALKTYVSDGFKVISASLNNAGHDGVTVGALAYQSTSTFTPRRPLMGVGI